MGSYIVQYLEQIMIATLLTLTALTYYSIPFELVSALSILPSSMVAVLFPAFSVLHGSDKARLEDLFWKALKYLALLMGLASLTLMIFSRELLVWWLGTDFEVSTHVLQLLSAGFLLGAISWHFSTFLQGSGYIKQVTVIALSLAAFQLFSSWYLIIRFGIGGAAVAFALARLIAVIALYCICLKFKLIRPFRFPLRESMKLASMLLVVIAITLMIKNSISIPLWSLVFGSPVLITGYVWICWQYALGHDEKEAFLRGWKEKYGFNFGWSG